MTMPAATSPTWKSSFRTPQRVTSGRVGMVEAKRKKRSEPAEYGGYLREGEKRRNKVTNVYEQRLADTYW